MEGLWENYSSGGTGVHDPHCEEHGGRQRDVLRQHLRTHILIHKQEAESFEWLESFQTQNRIPVTHLLQLSHTS